MRWYLTVTSLVDIFSISAFKTDLVCSMGGDFTTNEQSL